MTTERRTWDSPIRSPWNPKIHNLLKSIDLHVELYVETGDMRHLEMAQALRQYVTRLKDWILEREAVELSQHQGVPAGIRQHS